MKSKKRVITFDDSDLDKGLLSAENVEILKNLHLPLPSNIKNEKLEVIKLYQKNTEIHLDYFRSLLKITQFFTQKKEQIKLKH